MNDTGLCNNPECKNIGRKMKVKMVMKYTQAVEVHEVYLCRVCVALVKSDNGGFKN